MECQRPPLCYQPTDRFPHVDYRGFRTRASDKIPECSNFRKHKLTMLLLKLILTPLLLGGVTLVGRKFGPTVSGWLVGLPLTSGPVSFFLALEQGTKFAAHAAQGTLMGVISLSAFCVVYCWLSLRFGWLLCWLGSWVAYLVGTFIFTRIFLPPPLALMLAVFVLCISL